VSYAVLDNYFFRGSTKQLLNMSVEPKQKKKIVTFYCRKCKQVLHQSLSNIQARGLKHCKCHKEYKKYKNVNPYLKNSGMGYLYIAYHTLSNSYKIGISKNVRNRYRAKDRMVIIELYYGVLKNLWDIEQYILKSPYFKQYKWYNKDLKGNGATECFKCDTTIINEMKQEIQRILSEQKE
jgi:hypothetical protein